MPSLRPQRSRRATVAAAAVAVAGTAVVAFAGPANAATGHPHHANLMHTPHSSAARTIALEFIDNVNQAREAHGLPPVATSPRLTAIADRHSRHMAERRQLVHNLGLPNILGNWVELGENVGEGPTEGDVHQAFMQSAPHRANVLDPRYTQIGVGVMTDASGQVWVTEDFRRPARGTLAFESSMRQIHEMTAHHANARQHG